MAESILIKLILSYNFTTIGISQGMFSGNFLICKEPTNLITLFYRQTTPGNLLLDTNVQNLKNATLGNKIFPVSHKHTESLIMTQNKSYRN